MRGSTRVRILGWVLIPVLLVLVVSWVSAWALLTQRLNERIDTELAGEVSELRLLAEQGVDPSTGAPFADAKSLLAAYISRSIPDPNETMFVIIDGEVRYRTEDDAPTRLDLDPTLVQDVSNVSNVTFGDVDTTAGNARWVAVPVENAGQQGTLVVGIFSDVEAEELSSVMGRFLAIGLGAFALAAFIGWFVAGRLLKPLRQMRTTARQISESDLSQRIPIDANATDDVTQLAGTFNDMLDRLEEAFASQRSFVDDAGHELRTPLTIVQGHLELLDVEDSHQREETLALVIDELDRMNRMVRDLQTLTKSNQPGFVHLEAIELGPLMDEILVKAAALGDRRWELSPRAVGQVMVDRQRVTQAMLQLADNAVRHTADGDQIRIGAEVIGDDLVFSVADSGPGIPPEDRDLVTLRFKRGSTAHAESEGSGLGLALVTAIALAHHGHLNITDSPLGGAEIRLVVPSNASLSQEVRQ